MSLPLDTTLIEQRLSDAAPALQYVAGAADYATVKELRGFRHGSAYVVLFQEKATDTTRPPQARPGGRQQAEATIGVVIAARNYRDATGAAAAKDASPLIGAARAALMGWTPDITVMRPLQWMQGDVLDYDANTLLWIDVFTTTHFIGGNTP